MKWLFFLYAALFSCSHLLAGESLDENSKICVLIPRTSVREAIVRKFREAGFRNIITTNCSDSKQIHELFQREKPECVIVDGTDGPTASRSLLIDTHAVHEAHAQGVKKCFLLSSFAVYPSGLKIPFKESTLTALNIKKVTDPYSAAKMVAITQSCSYNDPENPHFIVCPYPFLYGTEAPIDEPLENPLTQIIQRINQAVDEKRSFTVVSNDGTAKYELLHIDDLAAALVFLAQTEVNQQIINIGSGRDVSIELIAESIQKGKKFPGDLIFDCTEFDEVPRRVLDSSVIQQMGWSPVMDLQTSLRKLN